MKAFWQKLQKKKQRIGLIALITVLFAGFQNCTLSSLSGTVTDSSSSSGSGPGVFGVSPFSVQLGWTGVASSTSYNIYNLNEGNTPIQNTTFTMAIVNKLQANTAYTFSIRGTRGVGGYLTDSLGTYPVTTWPLFTDVTFTSTPQSDSSVLVAWTYAPWTTTTLLASTNAAQSSNISCAMIPVAAGTDPSTVNPTAPGGGITPVTVTGSLFAQTLNIPLGAIDSSLTYAAQCTAQFIDQTSSVSTQNFLISPTQLVNPCATSANVGSTYSCAPNVNIPSVTPAPSYTIGLDSSNTCAWATLSGDTIQSSGTLTAASLGTCNLAYRYTVASLNYTSPVISRNVTVSVPSAFQVFPSFAVRAMSGAISFPHLYSMLTGSADTRAMVRSDLITDFGYGTTFFAGGSNPFPVFTPSAPALTSNFFYGFPVSAMVGGTQPTGFSLDAIRPTWQSTNPASEGFLRGNMVIPRVQITNPAFLTATGTTSSSSLYNFLTNDYTYNGGGNYSPAALSYYLTTISDRDVSGNPVSNTWNGSVLEESAVTFNIPTAQEIASFVPASGVNGQTTLLANANSALVVTGLVSSSANNSLFYVSNCQATPTIYPNPAACAPAGSAAPPTVISCFGDVIVQAPLLLVNPVFVTDSKGCRVHSTGTIFVQGSISALNSDGSTNSSPIELLSSRAVIFGFSEASLGVTNAGTRTQGAGGILDQTVANGTTNPYLTSTYSGPGAASAALNAIALDAQVVNLKSNDGSDSLATGATSFNHVAVCAPYVFSNYSGIFSGALIAEVAAFPYLNFAADSSLVGVTPFPLFTGAKAPLSVTSP